jgi:hypothetical protein
VQEDHRAAQVERRRFAHDAVMVRLGARPVAMRHRDLAVMPGEVDLRAVPAAVPDGQVQVPEVGAQQERNEAED